MSNEKEPSYLEVLCGIAAVRDMLNCIGDGEKGDHAVATILVEHELKIRALLSFALPALVEKL